MGGRGSGGRLELFKGEGRKERRRHKGASRATKMRIFKEFSKFKEGKRQKRRLG